MPTKTKKASVIKIKQDKPADHRKNIVKAIDKIAYKYGRHHVFNDLIYMSAAALSQPMDFRQKREDEYLRRINTYDKETQALFPEMFGELALAFEKERFGDILGDIYSSLELTNTRDGQFFTPYHICRFMAAVQGDTDGLTAEIERKGYIAVSDPCCGAGAMLIAFAEHCMDCGINYQQSVLFVAQDIDPAAALMSYVQMSLLGMAGYVIIGNSLIPSDSYDVWFTPTYYLHGFYYRTQKTVEVKPEPTADPIIHKPETGIPAIEADVTVAEDEYGQLQLIF